MKKSEIKVGGSYRYLNNGKVHTVVNIKDDLVFHKTVGAYDSCHIDWFCEKFEQCNGGFEEVESPNNGDALDKQVGGNHYKDLKIQPVEYTVQNNLGYLEGNVIKYVTRHEKKNGLEDIQKAIHYLELIKKYKYND